MSGAASDIIGTWALTINTPMGTQVVVLDLADDHTGVARYGSDSVPLENVRVTGNSVTCDVRITRPMALTLKCAVTVDGDTASGSASAGFFGTFALAGSRTTT